MGKTEWGFYGIDDLGDDLDGTAGAKACTIHGVTKRNSPTSVFLVANEFICGRLAMMMGLPVPPGVIVNLDDNSLAYASLRFGPKGETPPPADAAALVVDYPELALEIATFDCWVANDDRHEGNLAYARKLIDPMIFDHDKALLGATSVRTTERLEKVRHQAILDGCLGKHIQGLKQLGVVCDAVRWICDRAVPRICDEAWRAGAIDEDERDEVKYFLTDRAARLVDMMKGLLKPGDQGPLL